KLLAAENGRGITGQRHHVNTELAEAVMHERITCVVDMNAGSPRHDFGGSATGGRRTHELTLSLHVRGGIFPLHAGRGHAIAPRLFGGVQRIICGCYYFIPGDSVGWVISHTATDSYGPWNTWKMMILNL